MSEDDPARDPRYFASPIYWPDVLDPSYPYGEGVALQLRSAVSHLNEVWAVETAGPDPRRASTELGWEFTRDAARWLYDETRHMLMGKQRLDGWALGPGRSRSAAISTRPGSTRIRCTASGCSATSRRRTSGASASVQRRSARWATRPARLDMEFDWADETLHAEYGRRWLRRLLEARGEDPESWPAVLERCEQLVQQRVARATNEDLERIRACADDIIATAETRGGS